MKKLLISLLCLLLSFALCSCSTNNNSSEPPIQFDELYLNQQIQLFALPQLNTFKTKDSVGLRLIYNSENEITFPDNYGLRLFIFQDGNWIEIYEKPTIRSGEKVVLSPSDPISHGQLVSFFPKLDDLTKEYHMRAYIFGDMSTQEGVKRVAAFANFVLKP